MFGTVVDSLAILLGTLIGLVLPRIPDRMKETVTKGLALCVILIGLNMALGDTKDILIVIVSMVLGAVLGEALNIDHALSRFGNWVEHRVQTVYKGPIAEGFVSASLLFCVGSMAVVGAIQDGLTGNHQTLYAKSLIDMFSAIVFSATFGAGVGLSAIPVFLYQGLISLISHLAGSVLNEPAVIACLTATGGLLILGIGLNLYGVKKIAVANLLPAIVIAPALKVFWPWFLQIVMHALHIGIH